MKFKALLLTQILIFSILIPSFGQTCTSSGGDDDDLIIDDYPYHFRCGTAMMHDRMNKASRDYKLIESCDNYWGDGNYYSNNGKIYYSSDYDLFELVVNANINSFRCEDGTAKDNTSIYFKGKPVANIDKKSFKSVGFAYCADNKNVYYRNKYNESGKLLKVDGAASSTFTLIGDSNSNYAKDTLSVYLNGKVIETSDPASFTVLEYGYANDKNYVYYNGIKVEGMNGANFKVLKNCFLGSDGVMLCNGLNVLKNSDAKSFHAIECGYYQDNNNVYLNGLILEGIDSKTFEVLSWGYTKDKDAVYCDLQKIVGAEPSSFEVLGRKHSKDSKNIFYLHHIISCDYQSFEVDNNVDYLSKDKNYTYKKGIPIK